jgi:hypothetical protein
LNTTPKTVAKWVARFRAEGVDGLRDRSSRPLSLPSQGIATEVGVSPATVSRILQRLGLKRLSALEPAEPVRRYKREHPGEMIHIDIKKLSRIDGIGHRISGDRRGQSNRRSRGQGLGWEFVHVAIDDA